MSKPVTRREENREARRAAIVATARHAFLDHGYAATTMSTIAGELGGSKGTLWAYFPSKEELFAAVLDDVTAAFRASLDDALRPGRDCRTTLRDFTQRFSRKLTDPDSIRLHRLIVGECGRFPEIGRIFYARGPQMVLDRLSTYIRTCMVAGDLRDDDPMQAAMVLIQLNQMPQQLRLWNITDLVDLGDLDSQAEAAVALFMRAYAPDAPAV